MNSALDSAEEYLAKAGMLGLSGGVLYSGVETLRPGPIYLLGLNPGGSEGASLKVSLDRSRQGINCYLDEEWEPGGRVQPKGKAILQRRVQHLCSILGLSTRDVPASNLAFTRSKRVGDHENFEEAIRASMPVHEIFVSAIRPSFLMTFGAINYFRTAAIFSQFETETAVHGSWKAHRGIATFAGQQIPFGNVPHMSVWASEKRENVLRWALKSFSYICFH